MTDVRRVFADLTAAIEDLHGVAIEGQRRDNSPNMLKALAGHACNHLTAIESLVGSLQSRLDGSAE